jgi:hypothetical protein
MTIVLRRNLDSGKRDVVVDFGADPIVGHVEPQRLREMLTKR